MEYLIGSKCDGLIVVGMEIGITYSGCAHSWKGNWSKVVSTRNLLRIPTVLLLKNRTEFVAFGVDAEDKYAMFKEMGTHTDYLLFKRFARILYKDKVHIITYIHFVIIY